MYYFFLGPVLLPITPSSLNIDIGGNNQTVTLINDGEINILHDPKLKEVSFNVLLPTGPKYPFATYSLGGAEAIAFTTYFRTLQKNKIPFPFIVVKMRGDSLIPRDYEYIYSTIEEFSQTEDAENGLDIIVSLRLKEYRQYATIRVDATENEDGAVTYTAKKQRGKSFTSEITKLAKDITGKAGALFGL